MSLCQAFSSFEHHLRLFLLVTPLGLITGKDLFQNLKDVILSFHPLTLLSIRTLASVFAQARLLRQPVLHRLVRLLPLHLGLQALLHRRLPQRPRLVRDGRVRLCHGHVSSATGRKWKTPNGTPCVHAHTYEHTHTVQRSMVERARASVQAAWQRASRVSILGTRLNLGWTGSAKLRGRGEGSHWTGWLSLAARSQSPNLSSWLVPPRAQFTGQHIVTCRDPFTEGSTSKKGAGDL